MNKARSFLKRRRLAITLTLLCLLTVFILLYEGVIWPNAFFTSNYSVRGIDVSSYQKSIDWKSVAQTGEYQFVFIKATEGTGYKDAFFQANWRGTKAYGLPRGAYHFYTSYLPGAEQADNYISMVPKEAGMLPPVLDLEVTGKNRKEMLSEVKIFLDRLEHYYNMRPIIYTDFGRYAEYIQGNFEDYPLWVRDVVTPIQWTRGKNWTFWQYCDRGHVAGIPTFVDINVFYGDKNAFGNIAHRPIS